MHKNPHTEITPSPTRPVHWVLTTIVAVFATVLGLVIGPAGAQEHDPVFDPDSPITITSVENLDNRALAVEFTCDEVVRIGTSGWISQARASAASGLRDVHCDGSATVELPLSHRDGRIHRGTATYSVSAHVLPEGDGDSSGFTFATGELDTVRDAHRRTPASWPTGGVEVTGVTVDGSVATVAIVCDGPDTARLHLTVQLDQFGVGQAFSANNVPLGSDHIVDEAVSCDGPTNVPVELHASQILRPGPATVWVGAAQAGARPSNAAYTGTVRLTERIRPVALQVNPDPTSPVRIGTVTDGALAVTVACPSRLTIITFHVTVTERVGRDVITERVSHPWLCSGTETIAVPIVDAGDSGWRALKVQADLWDDGGTTVVATHFQEGARRL